MMTKPETGEDHPDLVTIGETMVVLVSRDGSRQYTAMPAGAESNVAAGMARLGRTTRWVSRLGDDPLGDLVVEFLGREGIDTHVVRDPEHPTGIMMRHLDGADASTVYYRSNSAASRLSIDDAAALGSARWLHLTGITPALSRSASDLVEHLLTFGRPAQRVSFDINLRPSLWPSTAAAVETLVRLGSSADVVLIGDDEAVELLGTAEPDAVAAAFGLDSGREIVVKRGAGGAVLLTPNDEVHVPGLAADVVDATGAGDAFAAGYLTGHCLGWSPIHRLRLGNLLGSRVVSVLEHVTPRWSTDDLKSLSPEWLDSLWASLDPA